MSVCCEEPLVFTSNSVISACWAETPAAVWCGGATESPRAACDGDNDFPRWDYYTAVSSLCTRPIKYAWMFEMNFGGSPLHLLQQQHQHQQPLLVPPSSPLSNYIIIFLSIKIRMNNLSIWQQPGSQREGFGTAAGRQGCFWWAMHAKLTLLWRTPKRNNERKRRKTNLAEQKLYTYIYIFNAVKFWCHNFKCATQKHSGWYEICNKAAAGGRPAVVLPHCQSRFRVYSQSRAPSRTAFFLSQWKEKKCW